MRDEEFSLFVGMNAPLSHEKLGGEKVVDLVNAVCEVGGVTASALRTKRREQPLTMYRFIAIALIREFTGLSTIAIGNLFNRDHSTVVYVCDEHKDHMQFDKRYRVTVFRVLKELVRAHKYTLLKRRIVVVHWDAIIVNNERTLKAEARPGAKEVLRRLKERNYYIIIYTPLLAGAAISDVINWLEDHKVRYDRFNSGHPAMEYLSHSRIKMVDRGYTIDVPLVTKRKGGWLGVEQTYFAPYEAV